MGTLHYSERKEGLGHTALSSFVQCPLDLRKMMPSAQTTAAIRECLVASLPRNVSSGLEYILQMGSLSSTDL